MILSAYDDYSNQQFHGHPTFPNGHYIEDDSWPIPYTHIGLDAQTSQQRRRHLRIHVNMCRVWCESYG